MWRRRPSQEGETQERDGGKLNAYDFPLVVAAERPVRFPGVRLSIVGSGSREVLLPPGLALVHICWVLCSFLVSIFQKAWRKIAMCRRRDTRMAKALRNCPVEFVRVASFPLSN